MLSNLLELAGFASLTAGSYELAGRGIALLVLAASLFFLGLAADGVHPATAARGWALGRWQRFRASRAERKSVAPVA
jgi:hypothetical protein